jgi:hypothetical protein
LLAKHWEIVREALDEPALAPPIIAYQSATNLVTQLVFQRASQLDKAAAVAATSAAPTPLLPKALIQPTLLQSFRAAPLSRVAADSVQAAAALLPR